MHSMNVPASRASFAGVWINGVYMGLYIMIEDEDKKFLDDMVGDSDGNLYKCRIGASLQYLGPNPDTYK